MNADAFFERVIDRAGISRTNSDGRSEESH
jgi:hypothetical protein